MDRKELWSVIKENGILDKPNVVLGGDLIFYLNAREVWGQGSILDLLPPFFMNLFHEVGLVDVEPT